MADDITNGELGRRLDDLKSIMQGLIGRPEYEADMRAGNHRVDDVCRDLAAFREQHDKDIKAVNQRISEQVKAAAEHRQSWRTVIYTGIIPALVVLVGILVQLWISHGGNH
jgi:hypothetical protein